MLVIRKLVFVGLGLFWLVAIGGADRCGQPRPPVKTAAVGPMRGEFSVSPSGTSHYRVPIEIPSGVGQAVPSIALAYASGAGDGLAGVGMVVEGLSAITRCAANKRLDGFHGKVGFDSDDRYCLDGKRMIAIGNNEYRLEVEEFMKIVVTSSDAFGPRTFRAYTRDGIQYEYGACTSMGCKHARIEAEGLPPELDGARRAMLLSKVTDLSGNFYEIHYTEDRANGDFRPSAIDYTGHATQDAKNRIEFEYEDRPDGDVMKRVRYTGPAVTTTQKRLTNIVTKVKNANGNFEDVYDYRISYEDTLSRTNRSRIHQIEQCTLVESPTVCKPPTVFAWDADGDAVAGEPTVVDASSDDWTIAGLSSMLGDYDGDGITDVFLYKAGNGAAAVRSELCTGSMLMRNESCDDKGWGSNWNGWTGAVPGDFNGDGKTDALIYTPAGINGTYKYGIYWDLNVWEGFDQRFWDDNLRLGDFDGDGATDVISFFEGGIWLCDGRRHVGQGEYCVWGAQPGDWTTDHDIHVADFDGDGRSDVLAVSADTLTLCDADSMTAPDTHACTMTPLDDAWPDDPKVAISDFDGDGTTDLLVVGDDSIQHCPGHAITDPSKCVDVTPALPDGHVFPGGVGERKVKRVRPSLASVSGSGSEQGRWVNQSTGAPRWEWTSSGNTKPLNRTMRASDCPGGTDSFIETVKLHGNLSAPANVDFNHPNFKMIFGMTTSIRRNGTQIASQAGTFGWRYNYAAPSHYRAYASSAIRFDGPCSDFAGTLSTFRADAFGSNGFQGKATLNSGNWGYDLTYIDYPDEDSWKTYEYFPGDYDADGISDLARVSRDLIEVCPGPLTGAVDNCEVFVSQTDVGQNLEKLVPGDFNGDGVPDMMIIEHDGVDIVHRDAPARDLIESIQVGTAFDGSHLVGPTTRIEYAPLTNVEGDVYTRSDDTVAGESIREVQNAQPVVRSVHYPDGTGTLASPGSYVVNHSYEGLHYDIDRRVALGFTETSTSDSRTGLTTTQTFSRVTYLSGRPASTEIRASNGTLISRTSTVWELRDGDQTAACLASPEWQGGTRAPDDGPCRYPLDVQTVEESFELDGTRTTTTTTTAGNLDAYGNVGLTTIQLDNHVSGTDCEGNGTGAGNANGGLAEYLTTTTRAYTPNLSAWTLSLPTMVTVNAEGPLGLDPARVTRQTYVDGLLAKTESQPGESNGSITMLVRNARGLIEQTQSTFVGNTEPTRTSTTRYDAYGHPVETENALQHVATAEFDSKFGIATIATDPNGVRTLQTVDGFGRVTRGERDGGGSSEQTIEMCDAACLTEFGDAVLVTSTKPSGGAWSHQYTNLVGQVVGTKTTNGDGDNIVTRTTYDSLGRTTDQSEPHFVGDAVFSTTTRYDLLNRPLSTTSPGDGHRTTDYAYLPLHERVQSPDLPEGRQLAIKFADGRGNTRKVTDAHGESTCYAYDTFNQLTETRDANGNATVVGYDTQGNRTSIVDPALGEWAYTYDGFGEQTRAESIVSGRLTTFSYDLLGRMVNKTHSLGSDVTSWLYTYDPANGKGKLASLSDGGFQTSTLTYDTHARLNRRSGTVAGTTHEVSYVYDAHGRVKKQVYPTATVISVYDDAGDVKRMQIANGPAVWTRLEKDARGNVTLARLGNGITRAQSFAPDTGEPQSIVAGTVVDREYAFDAVGNLRMRHDRLPGRPMESFGYDLLNRVTEAEIAGNPREYFAYDRLGNPTCIGSTDVADCATGGGLSLSYGAYGPHAVEEATQTPPGGRLNANGTPGALAMSFEYDVDGNQTDRTGTEGHRSVTYNAIGKPSQLQTAGAVTGYRYGSEGALSLRSHSGTDGRTAVMIRSLPGFEFWNIAGTIEHRLYISAPDGVSVLYKAASAAAPFDATKVSYVLGDHLGSASVVTDSTGALLGNERSYDVFGRQRDPVTGRLIAITTVIDRPTDVSYTGQTEEPEHNLYNYGARIYDPVIGRFLQPDPYVQAPYDPQNLNRYTYVMNNPLKFVDPTGNFFGFSFSFKGGFRFSFWFNAYRWSGGRGRYGGGYFGLGRLVPRRPAIKLTWVKKVATSITSIVLSAFDRVAVDDTSDTVAASFGGETHAALEASEVSAVAKTDRDLWGAFEQASQVELAGRTFKVGSGNGNPEPFQVASSDESDVSELFKARHQTVRAAETLTGLDVIVQTFPGASLAGQMSQRKLQERGVCDAFCMQQLNEAENYRTRATIGPSNFIFAKPVELTDLELPLMMACAMAGAGTGGVGSVLCGASKAIGGVDLFMEVGSAAIDTFDSDSVWEGLKKAAIHGARIAATEAIEDFLEAPSTGLRGENIVPHY